MSLFIKEGGDNMEAILNSFNNEQQRAVLSPAKYLQIIAGPGTGKTSTLAARILHLQFEENLSQGQILAISFSRAAKQQLITKMNTYSSELGYGSMIDILTFHSLAHRIVRYGIHTGESKFKKAFKTIPTEEFITLSPSIIKGLCRNYSNRERASKALSKGYNLLRQGNHLTSNNCNHWKGIDPDHNYHIQLDASDRILIDAKEMITFWKRIDRVEKKYNVTDFQGIINEAITLLKKQNETYKMITSEIRHILVDEYQDTSLSQEELLFALAGNNKNMTVVGDKNQTIYTFNGSNPDNLERFYNRCNEKAPSHTKKIELKKNYRSIDSIVNLSNDFIKDEVLEYTRESTQTKPVIVNTLSIKKAASFIASEILHLHKYENTSYSDICILYRKNSSFSPQAAEVIKELNRLEIPVSQTNEKIEDTSLKQDVAQLCDNYEDLTLHELMQLLQNDSFDQTIIQFIKKAMSEGATDTDDLLDYLVELDNSNESSENDSVFINTVHAAKGQEYPIVFILFIGDTQFPHGSLPDIEEEERLLYVGITRAKDKLYILGQHGIRFQDFLGKCKESEVEYKIYSSTNEEIFDKGFNEDDYSIVKKTTEKQREQEKNRMKDLEDLVSDW